MGEFIFKQKIEIEVRVVCASLGTAQVLASCLDGWCVDLTKPLPEKTGYELMPLGSFFDVKRAARPEGEGETR